MGRLTNGEDELAVEDKRCSVNFYVPVMLKGFNQIRQLWQNQGFKFPVGNVSCRDEQELERFCGHEQRIHKIGVFRDDNALIRQR